MKKLTASEFFTALAYKSNKSESTVRDIWYSFLDMMEEEVVLVGEMILPDLGKATLKKNKAHQHAVPNPWGGYSERWIEDRYSMNISVATKVKERITAKFKKAESESEVVEKIETLPIEKLNKIRDTLDELFYKKDGAEFGTEEYFTNQVEELEDAEIEGTSTED